LLKSIIRNIFKPLGSDRTAPISKRKIGERGEKIAVKYLKKKGFKILHTNYQEGHCEVDIIARDNDYYVFVEVKSCYTDEFGDPAEWVTNKKIKHLTKAAKLFILKNKLEEYPFRFDVVTLKDFGKNRIIEHFPDAFSVDQ